MTRPLAPEDVRALFALILGRPPENEAVVRHYAAMQLSAGDFARVLLDSEEVAERYRRRLALGLLAEDRRADWPAVPPGGGRVLLFGAFGNGNLGDAAQVDAVADLLRRMLPWAPAFAATSWERRAPYPFAAGAVFPYDAALRAELLPRAGDGRRALLVIGGGGLLGAPHFPLHAEAWVDWLARQGIPWALLGVGGSADALAEPGWRAGYHKLIAGAAWVGLRDPTTLAAARHVNPAAAWFPDPILARALLNDTADWSGADWSGADRHARSIDALVVPRTPNGAADVAANRAALGFADALRRAGGRVVVAGLERVLDRAHLGEREATYVEDWGALEALCRDSRLVVSARLHGVVAGLAAGCVVHGLVQPKIGELMASFGVGQWFAPGGWPAVDPDFSAEAVATFRRALLPGLARMRADLAAAMRLAADALTAATRPERIP